MNLVLWVATVFAFGWVVLAAVAPAIRGIERAGAATIVGTFGLSVVMFVLEIAGLPLRPLFYLSLTSVVALFLLPVARRRRRRSREATPRNPGRVRPVPFTALSIGVAALCVVMALRVICLPNRLYDSLTGFDLLGQIVAIEETIDVSLFESTALDRRGSYPPHTALTFAGGIRAGADDGAQVVLVWLVGFVMWMYGVSRRTMGPTSALALVAAVLTAPDANGYLQLPLTNLPVAFGAAMMVVYVGLAARERSGSLLAVAMMGAAITVWTRGDSVTWALGGAIAALWVVRRLGRSVGTSLAGAAGFLLPSIVLLFAWNGYAETVLGVDMADRFNRGVAWDSERAALLVRGATELLFTPTTMGLVAFALVAALVTWGRRTAAGVAPAWTAFGVAFVAYVLLFYQIDTARQDPLVGLLESSYRRGLTAFVFPGWWLVFMSPTGRWLRTLVGRRFSTVGP